MNDFNRGALQVPCLRLDCGFGEQWASVELGDGTGYVRLADYEMVKGENAKLRELVRDMYATIRDRNSWWVCMSRNEKSFADRMRELGIDVDG